MRYNIKDIIERATDVGSRDNFFHLHYILLQTFIIILTQYVFLTFLLNFISNHCMWLFYCSVFWYANELFTYDKRYMNKLNKENT
jgi:hypothetical protein